MALPTDKVELQGWIEKVVVGWKLEHHPTFTLFHAMMLGMRITRDDYNRIVRAYVDSHDEAKAIGSEND